MRLLPDSSILIPFFRSGDYGFLRDDVRARRIWLSIVVAEEVMAGARSPYDLRRYDRLFNDLKRDGFVLVPTTEEWERCGRLLSRFRQRYGGIKARDHQNDVLILLSAVRSAHEEETVLLTENDVDFATWLRLLGGPAGLRLRPLRRRS